MSPFSLFGKPNGSLTSLEVVNGRLKGAFSIRREGHVQVRLASGQGNVLQVMFDQHVGPGSHSFDASGADLPDGLSYVLLFYEGRLAHMQELESAR